MSQPNLLLRGTLAFVGVMGVGWGVMAGEWVVQAYEWRCW